MGYRPNFLERQAAARYIKIQSLREARDPTAVWARDDYLVYDDTNGRIIQSAPTYEAAEEAAGKLNRQSQEYAWGINYKFIYRGR